MLLVALIFTCNFSLMLAPHDWPAYFARPGGAILNLGDPTLVPRFLHSVLGAVAVAGLALAWWHERRGRGGDAEAAALVDADLRWFSLATMVNFGFGFWYYGSQPAAVRQVDGVAGALLLFFLLLGVVAIVLALIAASARQLGRAAGYTLATLICMALVRELVRYQTLAGPLAGRP